MSHDQTYTGRSFDWLLKYKLHHLPFWAVYHYFWWTIYEGGNLLEVTNNLLYPPYTIKYLSYVVVQAVGVYFCLYYLIPGYLEKGRVGKYLLYLTSTIVIMAVLIASGYYLGASTVEVDFYTLFKMDPNQPIALIRSHSFPSCIASMTLGMSIKLAKNWMESQKRQRLLEKEKLETELRFLKSQFNPHFLFNTINSIFVLINKNADLASDSLAKFSSLLRYQLYECSEAVIPLNRELAYLESFIELERLRQNEHFNLKIQVPESVGDLVIAPFILMPFVENAFKHMGENGQGAHELSIDIRLDGNRLYFGVSNSIAQTESARDAVDFGGLGLRNVRRRLSILYPEKHQLMIQEDSSLFSIDLTIELENQAQPEPILEARND